MTGIRIAQVRPQAENLSISPIKPMDLYIVSLMLLLGSQHRPPNGLRRDWATDFRQLSWDLPVCFLTTKALHFKWVCFSLYYRIPVSHSALRGANGQATGYMICMKWDEWVGELCVGIYVLILSLRYDSHTGGVWVQGVGWFKCLKTTSGPPGFANHTDAAAVARSFNQKRQFRKCSSRFIRTVSVWLLGTIV